jgi:gas vesicle protein
MNNTSKVILGLAAAATVGAAIGMLLAPEKGKDLQKRLKDGASQLLKEINELVATGNDIVKQIDSKTSASEV